MVGNGCVGLVFSPGTVDCSTGLSSIGQIGSPVVAVEHIQERLLGGLRQRLDGAAVDGDVHEHRRARDIHIPDAVMHQLVMPLANAGLQINGDDALAEQAVAGPVAAVVVAGGQFDGQIHHAELLVDADLPPHAGVAGVIGRILSQVL